MIHVKQAKGKKDRYVNLPKNLTEELKSYISLFSGKYVFPGRKEKITIKTIQKIFENALKKPSLYPIGITAIFISFFVKKVRP